MENPTIFPYREFSGLVYRVLDVLESEPENAGGLAVLRVVRDRVLECGNMDLLERVDRRLGSQPVMETRPQRIKTLRQLVSFISDSTDPGSVYVLRRTDRLGDREQQERIIRQRFPIRRLWFAPDRIGQRSPAIVFIQVTEEISEKSVEISGVFLTISRFVYDTS